MNLFVFWETEKVHTYCFVTTFVPWMPVHSVWCFLSTDSQNQFRVQHKVYTNYDLPLSYHLAKKMLSAQSLLPFPKWRKSRKKWIIFPKGFFKTMTRKVKCTLLDFQFQLNANKIRTLNIKRYKTSLLK